MEGEVERGICGDIVNSPFGNKVSQGKGKRIVFFSLDNQHRI